MKKKCESLKFHLFIISLLQKLEQKMNLQDLRDKSPKIGDLSIYENLV